MMNPGKNQKFSWALFYKKLCGFLEIVYNKVIQR